MVSSVAGELGANVQVSFGRFVVALALRSVVGLGPLPSLCWTHSGAQNLHFGPILGTCFGQLGDPRARPGPFCAHN